MRLIAGLLLAACTAASAAGGYFRFPAIHGDTVVFTAEGDLWKVPVRGGDAQRLTSHLGPETHAAISPDGRRVAFTGTYDGPADVYLMPLAGGLPRRLTALGDRAEVVGWNGDGEVLAVTRYYHGLRKLRLVAISTETGMHRVIPLEQVTNAAVTLDGSLVYTRGDRRGDNVREYRGGAMLQLWRYRDGAEAQAVTRTEHNSTYPMPWKGRIAFASDRSGVMNIWSMAPDGGDLRQHTHHRDFEVRRPAIHDDRVVYQHGADLRLLDLATGQDRVIPVRLVSDFEHQRERWVIRPLEQLTSAVLSPNGERLAIVARGSVVTAGVGSLRRIDIGLPAGSRARSAELSSDGKSVLVLSDTSGETELWTYPADGSGPGRQLTREAAVTRLDAKPSPDGKWAVFHDRHRRLSLVETATGRIRVLDELPGFGQFAYGAMAWSPDSTAVAVETAPGDTMRRQVVLFRVADGHRAPIASLRYASYSPSFSPDGKWLWFLGDRHFDSVVRHPWGDRNTGAFFDKRARAYGIALQPELRFPFQPRDELEALKPEPEKRDPTQPAPVRVEPPRLEPPAREPAKTEAPKTEPARPESPPPQVVPPAQVPATPPAPAVPEPGRPEPRGGAFSAQAAAASAASASPPASSPGEPPRPVQPVKVPPIAWEGLAQRQYEVPLPPGNYTALASDGKRLWFLEADTSIERKATLKSIAIDNAGVPAETFTTEVRQFQVSFDGKKLFFRKWASAPHPGDMYIVDPTPRPPQELARFQVRLGDWQYPVLPADEWRQIFADSWRMHRDWFYDRGLHGVDWKAMRAKYGALVARLTDRDELFDLLAQMSAELSLLHSQVGRGDVRRAQPNVMPATLGAAYEKAPEGVRIARIYRADPELISELPPLARVEVGAREGDIIVAINGRPVREVADVFLRLREQAGKQVLLELRRGTAVRKAIAVPAPASREAELKQRDHEWRVREKVDQASARRFGYIYLRAMGPADLASFSREFYTLLDREGLIIDVRGNSGGSIDSMLIEKLMRRPWAYWRSSGGGQISNMQASFRGPMVVLVDQDTYSDGETFAEGMRALGLATLVGERTSGAGVWLTDTNAHLDGGIARAAENVQVSLDGQIIIEGVGVKPDIAIENPPHATFKGEDAQLAEAIRVLERKLREAPARMPPAPPRYPRLQR